MTGVRVITESFGTACRARFKSGTPLSAYTIASFFAIFYLVTPYQSKVMRPENSGELRNFQLVTYMRYYHTYEYHIHKFTYIHAYESTRTPCNLGSPLSASGQGRRVAVSYE